ncbi:MAG: YdcF family protein [Holosporaceae bacterium]|jgi:uncharacterized SAM-binding protein YcdF (DUF218 family)|nr:YdcF family protein [Holosporaceae bacterium]
MRGVAWLAAAAVLVWLLALLMFMFQVSRSEEVGRVYCDNVAILTGGKNRIVRGVEFFKSQRPRNVFVSGVHDKSTLRAILGGEKGIAGVNFIMGKQAKNTRGNAREINEWISAYGLEKILVLTSDYHMPRSLLEIRRLSSHTKILVGSVKSEWNFQFLLNCLKEFHKIVYMYLRWFPERFAHGND